MNLYDDDDEAIRPATVAAGWAQGVGLYLLLLSGLCSGIIFLLPSQCNTVGWPIRHIVMISDHDHPGRSNHNDCADDVDQCCCQVRASQQLQPKKGAQPQVS